jgi:hypothetical protein
VRPPASQLVCFNGSNRSQGATRRLNLCEGADDTEQLIPIVAALGRLVTVAAPVTLVLDNLPAHTSLTMRAWLTDQHAWLTVA